MIPGAAAIATGTEGAARLPNGPRLGTLTSWRLVISPATGRRTLVAEGRFLRFWCEARPAYAEATVTPAPAPYRIGRKRPPTPRPLTFRGVVAELNPRALVIAEEAPE